MYDLLLWGKLCELVGYCCHKVLCFRYLLKAWIDALKMFASWILYFTLIRYVFGCQQRGKIGIARLRFFSVTLLLHAGDAVLTIIFSLVRIQS